LGNILEGLQKDSVDETLFQEDAEKELWKAFNELKGKVEDRAKNRDYAGALSIMAELRPQVDKFFDDVLVNDPKDAARKVNRHSLLFAFTSFS